MRISALLVNGEPICLEVAPETTGRELKQQIKERQLTRDEDTRRTTGVEIVLGERLMGNDETVADVGVTAGGVVSVLFKSNRIRCSNTDEIDSRSSEIAPEVLLVVELPSHETRIADRAFEDCKQVAKLIIPDPVTHIGENAFCGCSSLKNLTIPGSVTHIGDGAFYNCSSLANLTIPDSVTHIGVDAFKYCSCLVSLTIPNSVTYILNSAFARCSSLVNLTIPNSVTHIGNATNWRD